MPNVGGPRKEWDRRSDEGEGAYHQFKIYLDDHDRTGRRSFRQVARAVGVHYQAIRANAARHEWRERASHYDAWYRARVAIETRRAVKRIASRNARTIHDAFAISSKLVGRLHEMLSLPIVAATGEVPALDSDGSPLYRRDGTPVMTSVTYEAARWSYADVGRLLRAITEMRENALLLSMDMEAAHKPGSSGDEELDPALAEAFRRARVDHMANKINYK